MGGRPMMSYYRPAPKASWHKEGQFHVLYDGDTPVYRFGIPNPKVVAIQSWWGVVGRDLEEFRVNGRWVEERPATCEKTEGGYKFWSSGRWIVVTW